jgi:putative ABC transport system substrate-binding protein
MRAKIKPLVCVLTTVLLGTVPVHAERATNVPRVGFLVAAPLSTFQTRAGAFRQGLRELKYVDGKNIFIEWRSAEGKVERLPALATELVSLKVDVIVTGSPTVTRATKETTSRIPIVMALDNDPVGNGFVASLARPGGNITGLSSISVDTSGKQLELLKETIPRLSRVTIFGTSTNPGNAQALKEIELSARVFKIQLQYLDILDPKDFESAFETAVNGRANAVLVLGSPVNFNNRTLVAELAVRSRLPVIHSNTEYVEAGGLMTYGPNYPDLYRRAATYVDKILKGAKPADLPVEQPMKFEFIVNLKAAKQIGLTIPPNVLVRADRVIK